MLTGINTWKAGRRRFVVLRSREAHGFTISFSTITMGKIGKPAIKSSLDVSIASSKNNERISAIFQRSVFNL